MWYPLCQIRDLLVAVITIKIPVVLVLVFFTDYTTRRVKRDGICGELRESGLELSGKVWSRETNYRVALNFCGFFRDPKKKKVQEKKVPQKFTTLLDILYIRRVPFGRRKYYW